MDPFIKLLALLFLMQYVASGESAGGNGFVEHLPEQSRFKKFLNVFGMGTAKQLNPNYAYPSYGYPCPVTTTTTTPSPRNVPFMCPYPPMIPPQNLNFDGSKPQFLPRPEGFNQLPPPIAIMQLPPPGSGADSLPPPPPLSRPLPPPPVPGQHSFPILPGQKPPSLSQGESSKPEHVFPGELIPSNIEQPPKPVQEGGNPNNPTIVPPINPMKPATPVQVDPENPANPIKINPVITNPYDPVKVSPMVFDPTRPVQVNPINVRPNMPILIDPVQPGQPLMVPIEPTKINSGQVMIVDPFRPPPALNIDSKGFTNHHPQSPPYGPTNVLINPGIPEKPRPLPPPPSIYGGNAPIGSPPPINAVVPQRLPNGHINNLVPYPPFPRPGVRPPNVPIGHNFNDLQRPEMFHSPNEIKPPTTPNHPQGNPFPPFVNKPMESPGPYFPNPPPFPHRPAPGENPFPPFLPKPNDAQGPMCGSPFLKPYVPPGFHFSSITQYAGLGLFANPGGPFLEPVPCSTFDLLKKLDFQIMASLINSTGLLPLFERTKNYTLFVPSDASFRRLPRWFRDSLEADNKLKKALVLNHLVKDDIALSRLSNEELILSARPGGNRLRINVYMPESSYRTITVDGSEIEKGDILTPTGRIHIVQKVLMPNLPRNAAQFLSEKLEFESFWNLVKQADMIPTFQDKRPFTLFIPVNEAVAKLNDSTLLSDKDKLRNFLNYHMVNGTYYSNGLINNEFLLTNYEKEIKANVMSDCFAKSLTGINGKVKVIKADISLVNGVAHVIDQCISEEPPFYIYPQSDEFKDEFGVMRRNFRVTGEEKDIENLF